jgi:hypothetical protein
MPVLWLPWAQGDVHEVELLLPYDGSICCAFCATFVLLTAHR